MTVWQELIMRLLKHFDDNEGTTYLYLDQDRLRFVADTDPEIRDQVRETLELYHNVTRD